MATKITINELLVPVEILWSNEYACPVYLLKDGRCYIEDTDEYAGYFDELEIEVTESQQSSNGSKRTTYMSGASPNV